MAMAWRVVFTAVVLVGVATAAAHECGTISLAVAARIFLAEVAFFLLAVVWIPSDVWPSDGERRRAAAERIHHEWDFEAFTADDWRDDK